MVGGGIAGLATAARAQAGGLSTVVLERHVTPGGCAGWFERDGFRFDVGATTLVDFEPGGVGAQLLEEVGVGLDLGEALPGYDAWLPDRRVRLHRDGRAWRAERAAKLGDGPAHRRFWSLMDRLADVFWEASRRGIAMPLRTPRDLLNAARAAGPRALPLARYLNWTLGDLLRREGLRDDRPLVGLLSVVTEDTVHADIDRAPLINAALGLTIRGAGLTRANGGMAGFWERFTQAYRERGGRLHTGCGVAQVTRDSGGYLLQTRRGPLRARQVVFALPAEQVVDLAPAAATRSLRGYVERNAVHRGGSIVLCMGVPEEEVADQDWTHHQLLQDYDAPLGLGNNMFISVSAAGDELSAPPGHRAVMISTHCELGPWKDLDRETYRERKRAVTERLLGYARRVYPDLARRAVVFESGTPRTYKRFTQRPDGAVGGYRLGLDNANQRALPHVLDLPGLHLVGDTTWPGVGTVAAALGSRIVARRLAANAKRQAY